MRWLPIAAAVVARGQVSLVVVVVVVVGVMMMMSPTLLQLPWKMW